jgi:hypothetical protein
MPGDIGFILGSESYHNWVRHEHIHLRFEDYRGNGGRVRWFSYTHGYIEMGLL